MPSRTILFIAKIHYSGISEPSLTFFYTDKNLQVTGLNVSISARKSYKSYAGIIIFVKLIYQNL